MWTSTRTSVSRTRSEVIERAGILAEAVEDVIEAGSGYAAAAAS